MMLLSRCVLSASLLLLLLSCATTKSTTPSVEIAQVPKTGARTDAELLALLNGHPQLFDSVLRNNQQWQIQIIYTQIDRDADNVPTLKHYYFNMDPARYYYPASTVKAPAAYLALQKLNELAVPGLDKYSTMITGAESIGQTPVFNDPTTANGAPSIAHYIKKIFLVSDNDAYNRLYEFLGQEYLNEVLHRMGYDSVQLLHRLQISLSDQQNRFTNPVRFYDTTGRMLYEQPAAVSGLSYQNRKDLLGQGYMNKGQLVHQPFDFSQKNRFTLPDLHSILQSVIFPQTVAPAQRFRLTDDDYQFLYRYMSMMPGESAYPAYDTAHYPDGYVKFFLFGGEGKNTNGSVRIFNKVGDAYGFLHDVAYVVDFANGVEFMLSASILCNSNGIFNDDKYEYDSVGFPFFKNLGNVIYAHERQRKKKNPPDLSKFLLNYNGF